MRLGFGGVNSDIKTSGGGTMEINREKAINKLSFWEGPE